MRVRYIIPTLKVTLSNAARFMGSNHQFLLFMRYCSSQGRVNKGFVEGLYQVTVVHHKLYPHKAHVTSRWLQKCCSFSSLYTMKCSSKRPVGSWESVKVQIRSKLGDGEPSPPYPPVCSVVSYSECGASTADRGHDQWPSETSAFVLDWGGGGQTSWTWGRSRKTCIQVVFFFMTWVMYSWASKLVWHLKSPEIHRPHSRWKTLVVFIPRQQRAFRHLFSSRKRFQIFSFMPNLTFPTMASVTEMLLPTAVNRYLLEIREREKRRIFFMV